jgi:hypothetical protein
MDILFTTDKTKAAVSPKNGRDYSLEELQGLVGGYIELVPIAERCMVVNEEGYYGGKVNVFATEYAKKVGVREMFPNGFVYGDVLVCGENEIK